MSERPISLDEVEVVRWLLANAANKDVSEYSADSLRDAAVVPGCPCGCASIDFSFAGDRGEGEPTREALRATDIVAEGYALWPDGVRSGVMLWGRRGRLLGIELYDLDGVGLRRFPTVQVMRRWEDYYPADS